VMVTIFVDAGSDQFSVRVGLDATVRSLMITIRKKTRIPVDDQVLVIFGKPVVATSALIDEGLFGCFGISTAGGSTVQLNNLGRLRGGMDRAGGGAGGGFGGAGCGVGGGAYVCACGLRFDTKQAKGGHGRGCSAAQWERLMGVSVTQSKRGGGGGGGGAAAGGGLGGPGGGHAGGPGGGHAGGLGGGHAAGLGGGHACGDADAHAGDNAGAHAGGAGGAGGTGGAGDAGDAETVEEQVFASIDGIDAEPEDVVEFDVFGDAADELAAEAAAGTDDAAPGDADVGGAGHGGGGGVGGGAGGGAGGGGGGGDRRGRARRRGREPRGRPFC
jgi:hypothetical protein